MATILRRSDGTYQAQVRRKGVRPVFRTFRARADALQWARAAESEIDRGIFIDRGEAERTTLAQLIDRYASEITPRKKGTAQERSRLKNLAAELGQFSLSRLQARHVAAYRDSRLRVVSGTTVVKELTLLSHILDTARKEWSIPCANPVAMVTKPRQNRPRERRLHPGEEALLLTAAGYQMRLLIVLALETAMRLGELLGLEWANIDLEVRVAVLPTTKNGDRRRVPLSPAAVAALGEVERDGPRVFSWKRTDSAKTTWRGLMLRTGIKGLTFHDLRHEATSRLFEKGLNPMEVAAITGHKTLSMLRRYTHLRAEDLAKKL